MTKTIKERPILFSAPMVRAILDGRKTQTRRVVKPKDLEWMDVHQGLRESDNEVCCPYGMTGDRLWVRETWAVGKSADTFAPSVLHPGTWLNDKGGLWYPADNTAPPAPISPRGKTRVSIHMPRWASRILLEIVSVRVERLNDISEQDARAEGCSPGGWQPSYSNPDNSNGDDSWSATDAFAELWESINGASSWQANPWVWVVEFRRV